MIDRERKRLDFARAFGTAQKLLTKQAALAVETDPKARAELERDIAVRDDALTPPTIRHAGERTIRAREKKRRLRIRLQRWLRLYDAPANIKAFILKIESRGWTTVAPPGSERQPGAGRPRPLSHETVRAMLRSLGFIGERGRKIR
jgi:hypothetical protein